MDDKIYDEVDVVLDKLLNELRLNKQEIIRIDTDYAGDIAEVLINYDFDIKRSGVSRLNFKTENLDYRTKEEEFNAKIYLTVNGEIVNILRK